MRKLKKSINVYTESSGKRNNTEYWYIQQVLGRELNHIAFSHHINEREFRKLAKKNKEKHVYFVAILDVDFDYKRIEHSSNDRMDIIHRLATTDNVTVYLTARAWENWLVLHFTDFNKHTDNNTKIPIKNYEKNSNWYTKQAEFLKETLDEAIARSQKLRKKHHNEGNLLADVNKHLNLRDRDASLKILEKCNPISYIDLFIQFVRNLENEKT